MNVIRRLGNTLLGLLSLALFSAPIVIVELIVIWLYRDEDSATQFYNSLSAAMITFVVEFGILGAIQAHRDRRRRQRHRLENRDKIGRRL